MNEMYERNMITSVSTTRASRSEMKRKGYVLNKQTSNNDEAFTFSSFLIVENTIDYIANNSTRLFRLNSYLST